MAKITRGVKNVLIIGFVRELICSLLISAPDMLLPQLFDL
jgi:hypothetical protein